MKNRRHTGAEARTRLGLLRPALLSLSCALALAACGSSDDDSGNAADPNADAEMQPTDELPDADDPGAAGDPNDPDQSGEPGDTDQPADAPTDAPEDTPPTDDPAEPGAALTTRYAFVSGATPVTFDAGQIERLTLGEEIVSSGMSEATGSDIDVATDGTDVYQIGRFQLDSLTRFSPTDLRTPVWQYSVNGEETAANPYTIVFASESKAYVVRYGSPKVWIVDPSAGSEDAFKTGEIDLSAYDADGVPDAAGAVLVDGKLFVLMQRLEEFAPTRNGYVAVIDTATDTEIDTGMSEDGLPGIALSTSNPEGISYSEDTGDIFVVGRGNIFFEFNDVEGDPYDGGIQTIDPDSYAIDLLIDDGTEENNEGFVSGLLAVSANKGYLLYYTGPGSTTLRSFNPMTGIVEENAVDGFAERDISVLAEGPEGRIWIGVNGTDERGFTLIDPSDDSVVVENVPVEFNPNGIVFIEAVDEE